MTALKPAKITKVLIANRGEIAVRIIRAAKDAGISSVAIYADQDRNAMHTRMADESYALNGTTSADTYLVIEKILEIATSMDHSATIRNGEVHVQADADWAATLNRAAFDAGITLAQLTPQLPNLEETFFEMTGEK